ncbi:MAG: hypothetical protein J0653_01380, partial [Deltaproteobacteria bacterium]|nr:hypothetical protein [Deltaproteobacteria bacterium]
LDNYLVQNGIEVGYEGSVVTNLLHARKIIKVPLDAELARVEARVKVNLREAKYQGVLVGIQRDMFLAIFPELRENYELAFTQTVKTGQFTYPLDFYVPKQAVNGN